MSQFEGPGTYSRPNKVLVFTFHYESIRRGGLEAGDLIILSFTFHYESIRRETKHILLLNAQLTLHFIMSQFEG